MLQSVVLCWELAFGKVNPASNQGKATEGNRLVPNKAGVTSLEKATNEVAEETLGPQTR